MIDRRNMLLKTSCWVSAATCAVAMAGPAAAQTKLFRVPAQPAATGVTAFARQADLQILAAASAVRGQRTSPVVGRYSVDSGLKKLISGTTLRVASNDGRTVTLHRGAVGGIELASADPALAAASASAMQGAYDAASEPAALDEVIVTARKVEENAQSVPIAITAFSGDQLEEKGVQRITDLQYVVPGLVLSQAATSAFNPLISLRGQTQTTIAVTTDPSIGIYMDGVYMPGTLGVAGDSLIDMERVEVLKGPQGTLFGRNTTGGAISFYTRLPTDEFEGEVTAGLGSDRRRAASGVLNIPIAGDKAAVRLVASTYSRNGFGFDTRQNRRIGDLDISTLRAALKWNPVEQVEVIVRADWVKAKDNGLLLHPIYIDPNPAITVVSDAAIGLFGPGGNVPLANRQAAIAYYQGLVARDMFSVAYDTDVFDRLDTANGSLTVAYDFGPAQLKSITAVRRLKDRRLTEVDASDIIRFTNNVGINLEQVTQEFQFTGVAIDDRLTYATGVFFYHMDGDEPARPVQFGNLLNGNFSVTRADLKAKSYAVYGQATYALTDTVKVTGGLRYTDETKTAAVLGGNGNNAVPFVCTLPASLSPTPACESHFKLESDNVSYVAALDWTPAEGVLIYARTARGYKGGTVNGRLSATTPLSGVLVLPEDVTDYELGIKSDWFDRRLRINADIYRSNYENIQRSQVVCTGSACGSLIQNAASAKIDGFEFEATAAPMRGLQLGFAAAYTKPKYKEFLSGGLDNTREKFLEVPEWAYSISLGYTQPTGVGDLHGQVDWSWRSDLDMAPQDYPGNIRVVGGVPVANGPGTPDSIRIQDSYGLLNASVSLELERFNTEVRLFGGNLLDKRYYSHALGNATALGVSIGTPGAPRTWGVDVTVHF